MKRKKRLAKLKPSSQSPFRKIRRWFLCMWSVSWSLWRMAPSYSLCPFGSWPLWLASIWLTLVSSMKCLWANWIKMYRIAMFINKRIAFGQCGSSREPVFHYTYRFSALEPSLSRSLSFCAPPSCENLSLFEKYKKLQLMKRFFSSKISNIAVQSLWQTPAFDQSPSKSHAIEVYHLHSQNMRMFVFTQRYFAYWSSFLLSIWLKTVQLV